MQTSSYTPFAQEVMADPLVFYQQLRDDSPVHYLAEYDTFAISRFQDVWDVLGNGDGTFVATEGTLPPADRLRTHNAAALPDPPLSPLPIHAVFGSPLYEDLRQSYGRAFRPRSVGSLESLIRQLANQQLDELLPRRQFDLTQEYGGIVAASVMCHLLGLPMSVAADVLATVNAGSLAKPGRGVVTADARSSYFAYLVPLVGQRREHGADGTLPTIDGLLDFRLSNGEGSRPLTDEEIAMQLLGIFIGGTETVPKVAAHGLWELQRRPDQLAAVRADLVRNVAIARDEIVRYCAPAQWFLRTVRKPVEISGTVITPGQRVMCLIASASRDEREYPEPDEFRWNRNAERSVAFGRGQHFCVGYHLARLEVAILIEEWLKRVSSFEVDEARSVRLPSSFQWGWNSIVVQTD